MRGKRLTLFWAMFVALMLLFVMPARAKQGEKHLRHHVGDVWVGCVQNDPTTTVEEALTKAFSIGNKENRTCWVNQKKGWWIFHRIQRSYIVRFRKIAEGPTIAPVPFSYLLLISGDRLYNDKNEDPRNRNVMRRDRHRLA
jgi:hypothetical protein